MNTATLASALAPATRGASVLPSNTATGDSPQIARGTAGPRPETLASEHRTRDRLAATAPRTTPSSPVFPALDGPRTSGVSLRPHTPDRDLTRQERYRLASEALRRGDRDRAVDLLNQNKRDDGYKVLTILAIEFGAGALVELAPVAAAMVGLAVGVESCEKADLSVALGVAGARSGVRYRNLPQGISAKKFDAMSKKIRERIQHLGDDIEIQGSRASHTAHGSDVDIAIRVSEERFAELIDDAFGSANPGSARERSKLHAVRVGKINPRDVKLHRLRDELPLDLGMDVALSVIEAGGDFDRGPFILLAQ